MEQPLISSNNSCGTASVAVKSQPTSSAAKCEKSSSSTVSTIVKIKHAYPELLGDGHKPGNVGRLLKMLGISFKSRASIPYKSRTRVKVAGNSFWLLNEGQLDYIYHDFKVRSRLAKAEAHPDRGGSTADFQALSCACEAVERAFNRRGIGSSPGERYLRYESVNRQEESPGVVASSGGLPKKRRRPGAYARKKERMANDPVYAERARLKNLESMRRYHMRNRGSINAKRNVRRRKAKEESILKRAEAILASRAAAA